MKSDVYEEGAQTFPLALSQDGGQSLHTLVDDFRTHGVIQSMHQQVQDNSLILSHLVRGLTSYGSQASHCHVTLFSTGVPGSFCQDEKHILQRLPLLKPQFPRDLGKEKHHRCPFLLGLGDGDRKGLAQDSSLCSVHGTAAG